MGGQSQGGGQAAYIAVHHRVARVLCFGSPKDYSQKLKAPAPWYHDRSATPPGRFFAFNHRQDANSCSPAQMLANMKALGMDAFGPAVDVEGEAPPFHHAHILYTSFPRWTRFRQHARDLQSKWASRVDRDRTGRLQQAMRSGDAGPGIHIRWSTAE